MSREKDENVKKIERLIAFARERFGSTQQLSMAMGRSHSYFGVYLSKGTLPGVRILKELVALGLNLHWLETGEGEMLNENAVPTGHEEIAEYTLPNVRNEFDDIRLDLLWDDAAKFSRISQTWDSLDVAMHKHILVKVSRYILDIQIELFIQRPVEEQVKQPENPG